MPSVFHSLTLNLESLRVFAQDRLWGPSRGCAFPGILARCLHSWNTTRETMILAQPPESPSVYTLPKSYPRYSRISGAHDRPSLDPSILVNAFENGQLSRSSVLVFLRLPLDSASTYLSIYPVTSELTVPVYPQNTHIYPPLPRWH